MTPGWISPTRCVKKRKKRPSWRKATENGFRVGAYEELMREADLVVNLTPDKQHSAVVQAVQSLKKASR